MRKVGVMFLPVIAVAGFVTIGAKYLIVKKVECYTQYGECPEEYYVKGNFLIGRPIYLPLPKYQLEKDFFQDSRVDNLSIFRRLPNTVVLGVSLRRPMAAVLGASDQLGIVDESGVVFEITQSTALPVIRVDGDIVVGSRLNDYQTEAVAMLVEAATVLQTPLRGYLQEGTLLIVDLPFGGQLMLDVLSKNPNWEASLQSIWARSKIDGKVPARIDLRFSNPVVAY